MESLTFTSLGGECELYGIDVGAGALDQARAWITRMHDRLTRFEPNSELSRLNASRGGPFAVSSELEALLREALRAFELSDGLVNVAVLPALLAAGYTRDFAAGPTATAAAPRIPPLPEVLHLRPGEARLLHGAAVDLGGIAKGWLVDRVSERLGENVLVNLCGDLYARGGGETREGGPPSHHRSPHRAPCPERPQRGVGARDDGERRRDLREGRPAARLTGRAEVAR